MTLKAARINKGLTQIKAAKLLGISVDTLRMYETGKTPFEDYLLTIYIRNAEVKKYEF
jgi:transcriptional regulator with XRE-family HTH domain